MRFAADLHLHSHFSRATSRQLDLEHLAEWAQLKGITVVGSADFTHPGWFSELERQLEPAEPGLFRLRSEQWDAVQQSVPFACRAEVRFMLTVEISSIYKQGEKTRRVHNVVLVPDFRAARRLNRSLARVGNLASDGRPILGLNCRELLARVLDSGEGSFLIPAHIWTPHFAVLGSASGFDSISECFADLSPHVFAVETGLSSDPPMNWRLSQLDGLTLVSNSDAHSPSKLGREATLFNADLSFQGIRQAIETGDSTAFAGTIEFFPEEGKYHFDGHRACGVRWSPNQTKRHKGICPVCGKPVTVGVLNRVEQLADRRAGFRPNHAPPVRHYLPLPEILGQLLAVGPSSRKVEVEYRRLLARLGSELVILGDVPVGEIERAAGPGLARAIERTRLGKIRAEAGYDGMYGSVSVTGPGLPGRAARR